MPRREQYMWRVSDKYTKKPFSQLKQAELHGIFGKRSAAEYTKKGLEQMRVPQGTHISPRCLRLNAGQVPKGPRLKGVYTPFRGCRLQAAGVKEVFRRKTREAVFPLLPCSSVNGYPPKSRTLRAPASGSGSEMNAGASMQDLSDGRSRCNRDSDTAAWQGRPASYGHDPDGTGSASRRVLPSSGGAALQ